MLLGLLTNFAFESKTDQVRAGLQHVHRCYQLLRNLFPVGRGAEYSISVLQNAKCC
jgi:hypothetical protein